MTEILVTVDGMACSMCESHINNVVRQKFPVKRVNSSHSKGLTTILTEEDIDEDALRSAIDATGYRALSIEKKPYEKKKGRFRR